MSNVGARALPSRVMLSILVTALAVFSSVLFSCSRDDPPTGPGPVKDYPVYIADINSDVLFKYHPTSRCIDTIPLTWNPDGGIAVSPDGKVLYLSTNTSVVVVTADSLSLVTELPFMSRQQVTLSPDGQYVAITGDDLVVLRTSDYSLVFSDTDVTENGRFSSDGKRFYCAAGWSPEMPGIVYRVDLSDGLYQAERLPIAAGGVIHVVPSLDETLLFLYLRVPGTLWEYLFQVYDMQLDSIMFSDMLIPGGGKIELDMTGRLAFYTNPGISGTDPPSSGMLRIYDAWKNILQDSIPVFDYVAPPCLCAPNFLAVTPDNRWLIVLGGGDMAPQVLYLYDIDKRKLVDYVDFGTVILSNPAAQKTK